MEKPKIIIVNEDDKVIDYKDRDCLEKGDIYRISALWIANSRGDILLTRRGLDKAHDPGKWGPAVAGTVDKGEDYDLNIVKEAEEELGLKNIEFKKGPKERISGEHDYFVQWYLLECDKSISEFRIQEEEVEEVKWFSEEELKRELKDNPDNFLDTMNQWVELFCK